ncbi:MAG TPA: hypothetical protein VNO52_09245 [Methylomirabilota bacterium]|nr:hypothetical protein [Methylomirabilota bacterium]
MTRTASSPGAKPAPADHEAGRLRSFLRWILLLELVGIEAELLLSGHTADFWQSIPVALIAAALAVLAWDAAVRRPAPVYCWRAVMLLFLLSGFLGAFLHYRAKAEFQFEVNPSLQGTALFWEAVKSLSPPTLAPGVMIQIGLLGLAWAHRHPALRDSWGKQEHVSEART